MGGSGSLTPRGAAEGRTVLRHRCKDTGADAASLAQLPWGLNLLSSGLFLEAQQSSLEATGSSEGVTGRQRSLIPS